MSHPGPLRRARGWEPGAAQPPRSIAPSTARDRTRPPARTPRPGQRDPASPPVPARVLCTVLPIARLGGARGGRGSAGPWTAPASRRRAPHRPRPAPPAPAAAAAAAAASPLLFRHGRGRPPCPPRSRSRPRSAPRGAVTGPRSRGGTGWWLLANTGPALSERIRRPRETTFCLSPLEKKIKIYIFLP